MCVKPRRNTFKWKLTKTSWSLVGLIWKHHQQLQNLKIQLVSSSVHRMRNNYTVIYCTVKASETLHLKKILFKIGFIEETRITLDNQEVPQTFFYNSHYSWKYDVIRLTPYHWQPCISQFGDITKDWFCKISRWLYGIAYYSCPKTTPAWPTSPILDNSFLLTKQ